MNSKTDVAVILADLQLVEDYVAISLSIAVPDILRPTCTALPILLAERFIVLLPAGQELAMVNGYLQALRAQQMGDAMLERFQRSALGHAAICVVDGERLWLPKRLANWLGSRFETQQVSGQEVRLASSPPVSQ